MNERQYHALELRETDIEGAIRRMCDSEELYSSCLRAFLDDETVERMNIAIENMSWDEAFTAAHALKGVAGNMGFVPLMHNTGQLIIQIRRGHTTDIPTSLERVNSSYRDIVDGINQYFACTGVQSEGDKR